MRSNVIAGQILAGSLAGAIMLMTGFAWARFGEGPAFYMAVGVFSRIISFHNQAIFAFESIAFLSIICRVLFHFKPHRLVSVTGLFLVFPVLWTMLICVILFGKILPWEFVSTINNFTTAGIMFYAGDLFLPAAIAVFYYMRNHRDKPAEISTLVFFAAVMNILFYKTWNALIIACAYFSECGQW